MVQHPSGFLLATAPRSTYQLSGCAVTKTVPLEAWIQPDAIYPWGSAATSADIAVPAAPRPTTGINDAGRYTSPWLIEKKLFDPVVRVGITAIWVPSPYPESLVPLRKI